MPAGATLSYHRHCYREGVLPCQQVPLSHVIVIATGGEYCHAGRCHSLIPSSLLREGILPCRQVPLSHIIVISEGREYCHAGRCHSLTTCSLLQQGQKCLSLQILFSTQASTIKMGLISDSTKSRNSSILHGR